MQPAHDASSLLAERWARRWNVAPLAADERTLTVATARPEDLECERALAFASGRRIVFVPATEDDITMQLDALYGSTSGDVSPAPAVEVHHLTAASDEAPPAPDQQSASSATVLVDELLAAAIAGRASDLHLEADEQGIAVRQRVDGVLRLVRRLPRGVGPALVSRIKILSGLDIADRLRPQDGRARVAVHGRAVDLRVSTLPASHGEKVVIRVLDGGSAVLTLDAMGFHEDERERIERLLGFREGLILVTGPTGSGKTTTLYAALRQLRQLGVNIVTVEDPIEYRLPGIVQVQVRERAGLTFASALRSIMRQDPDVILVGEIRDRETAEIAIQASLTGHLVLSTLHTNDAASAVTRLVDVGVPHHKIAAALKGVVAQRLLRRSCAACGGALRTCAECGGSGFRGRLAIAEVLVAGADFAAAMTAGADVATLVGIARRDGMRTLWESGAAHVEAGRTTLPELRRVAGDGSEAERSAAPAVARVDEAEAPRYLTARPSEHPSQVERAVAQILAGTVDVYVIRPLASGWRVLALQRGQGTRCPTAWETVHGRLEAGEEPPEGAMREVREETGLAVSRLYSITVQPYYLQAMGAVQLAVVFAAFVDEPADVTLGDEHQRHEWLDVAAARERFHWPREKQALDEVVHLLRGGDAGPVEDVLRVV